MQLHHLSVFWEVNPEGGGAFRGEVLKTVLEYVCLERGSWKCKYFTRVRNLTEFKIRECTQ